MLDWTRRGDLCTDVVKAVQTLSNQTLNELKHPAPCQPERIKGLETAAEVILRAAVDSVPAVIIGDYDTDGITATAILSKLLSAIGVRHTNIIPKRFTDGYGVIEKHVHDVHDSLIITVDNGIAAGEVLDACVERGNMVVVIDHHIPDETIPTRAAAIVNPHVSPAENDFIHYCGAGLAYKLATFILRGYQPSPKLDNDILVLAGIGTVGDCMPLVGDNRIIVRDMLAVVNKPFSPMSAGLQHLFYEGGWGSHFSAREIGFWVSPMINAPGRLYDTGGTYALELLLCDDTWESIIRVDRLKEINEERRQVVMSDVFVAQCLADEQTPPYVVYAHDFQIGTLSAVAGRMRAELGNTAIVLTDDGEGMLKGSMRTLDGVHARNLLASASAYLTSYGGHAGAAACRLRKENLQLFTDALRSAHPVVQEAKHLYYDVDLASSDVAPSMRKLSKLEPLGMGVPTPVCLVHRVEVREVRYLGRAKDHVTLSCDGFSVQGIRKANLYRELGEPACIDVVGTLKYRYSGDPETLQLSAMDFWPAP